MVRPQNAPRIPLCQHKRVAFSPTPPNATCSACRARFSTRAKKKSTTKTDRIKLQSGSREAEPSPAVKCVKMSPSCLNSGKEATRVPALTLPLQKYRPKSVLAARNFNISPNKKSHKITLSDRRLFRSTRNHCPNAGWQNSPTGSKS